MRSFIAINLPQSIKRDIDMRIGRLRTISPPARWVPGNNLHLTLKFLDEITAEQVAPLRDAIASAVSGARPFPIRLGGFGVFPNERRARVFWVGMDEGVDYLKPMARKIDLAVHALGFLPEEHPFSAHITLARFREPGPVERLMRAAADAPYQSEMIQVDRVELMKSILSANGAQYSTLESIPFAGHLIQ